MKRREFMELVAAAGAGAMLPEALSAQQPGNSTDKKLVGMYVHECWIYNRPYAARSWTDSDWHGYLEGLSRLGYNLVTIWPQVEIMPRPLTPSDQAKLDQHRRVIEMAHSEFGMKVWITIAANVAVDDDYAGRVPFERRSYFGSDLRVNPGDKRAVDALLARREELLRPLAAMDALVVIDSDPGGYPNSTNKEFVDLLVRHRHLLDRLRPGGIELVYWVWAGWQAYARFYATGEFAWGKEAEFLEALTLLKERNPEPWGLARGLEYAEKLGLQSKVINFNYGAIELEPTFPMTNFGKHAGGDPYQSGRDAAPRGEQANAQTHCVQLPGTFAFARGAKGLPLADNDYVAFANELIPGRGEQIVSCWQAIGGMDVDRMKHSAAQLAPFVKAKSAAGPLRGLLFGEPGRFLRDLYVMLHLKAACLDLINATQAGGPTFTPLADFVSWLDRWCVATGYDAWWGWMAGGDINAALLKIKNPQLEEFFRRFGLGYMKTEPGTPRQRITSGNYRCETETLRLLRILKRVLWEMDPKYPNAS